MAKIAMISQPMRGKTDEEIKNEKELAEKILKEKGYEVFNTLFEDDWSTKENLAARGIKQVPLYFLARSLRAMSHCDAVYFCKGWDEARGCIIEEQAAKAYGLELLYAE